MGCNMKTKRSRNLIIVMILILSIVASYGVVNAVSKARQLGLESKKINSSSTAKDLAKVGSVKINAKDVENYKINMKLQQAYIEISGASEVVPQMTDKEVLDKLIENAALYLEAEKLGLVVPEKTVNDYIASMKKAFIVDKSKELNLLRDYVDGLGITLNEYIDNIKPLYIKLMSVGRLRSVLVGESNSLDESVSKWNDVKKEIAQKYQSQVELYN